MQPTQIPQWSLGDRLRKARQVAGIKSHKEMAHRLGVSEDTVKRYESEKYAPTRAVVLGWAVVCGVDPHWLEKGYIAEEESAITGAGILYESREIAGQIPMFGLDYASAA